MKNKDQEKKDHSKKFAAGTSLLLALALLTTSSLAFRDASQHKENIFKSSGPEYNVVLVEEFEEVDDWKEGTTLDKKVHVQNGQKSDPTDQKYEDAYIRLKFSEYLGIKEKRYHYSDDPYMIDAEGEFIRVDGTLSLDSAVTELKNLGVEIADDEAAERVVIQMDGFEKKEYYYVKSIANDPNGQWGKKIVTEVEELEETSLVGDVGTFTPHLWTADYESTSRFKKHVKWNLGEDVITLDDWKKDYNSRPVKKWILDTTDTKEGWAYWGEPLVHITEDSVDYETSKILESVTSIMFPEGSLNYVLKVNMDAFSRNKLIKFKEKEDSDWNVEIGNVLLLQDELSVSMKGLQDNIAKAKKLIEKYPKISVINALREEVKNSEQLLYNHLNNLKSQQVEEQNTKLENKIQAVSDDELAKKSLKYIKAIEHSNNKIKEVKDVDGYFEGAISLLEETVEKWETQFINSAEVSEEDINNAISDLQLKYSYISKDKIEFAGFEWNVLGVQEETISGEKVNVSMLILAEPLKNDLYSKLKLDVGLEEGVKYIIGNHGAHNMVNKNFDEKILQYKEDSEYIINKADLGIEEDFWGKHPRIASISDKNLSKNIYLNDFKVSSLPTDANPYLAFEVDNTVQGFEASYWTNLNYEASASEPNFFITPEGFIKKHEGQPADQRSIRPVIWINADQVERLGRETMPKLD